MKTGSEDILVRGHCYCGGITFEVHIPAGESPLFAAYCHCDSCRRAHAAPLYHMACVDEHLFTLTGGADLLTDFSKPGGNIVRSFCSACGTRILNRFGGWKPGGRTPLAFFPSLLEAETQKALPESLRPGKNNRPGEHVLDAVMLQEVLALE